MSQQSSAEPRAPAFWLSLLLGFVLFVMTYSRRSAQLRLPQVWDEDGASITPGGGIGNIPAFLSDGWHSLLQPVNGYLIVVPKLITAASLSVSFYAYPLVSTILAWAFMVFVGLCIALSPTRLSAKWICALLTFAIPTDPEVFGIPLYTFWWASLLLFLLVLWQESANWGWRLFLMMLGGLSSPVVLLALPAFYFRVLWLRRNTAEKLLAISATVISAIQAQSILGASAGATPPFKSLLLHTVPKFFGSAFVKSSTDNPKILWALGLIFILILLFTLYTKRNDVSLWLLSYLLFGSVALSVLRVDPAILDPQHAGPRYFFFPFVLMYWTMVQIFFKGSAWITKLPVGLMVLLMLANAVPSWSRRHDDLKFSAHANSCQYFTDYNFPIQFDGNEELAWSLVMTGAECARLLATDPLYHMTSASSRTYPFTVGAASLAQESCQSARSEVVALSILGTDYQHSTVGGCKVVGTYVSSDMDTGALRLRLKRGDSVLYRSGPSRSKQSITIIGHEDEFLDELPPAINWINLTFSNARLPESFEIEVWDDGRSFGEWSAIAVRQQ